MFFSEAYLKIMGINTSKKCYNDTGSYYCYSITSAHSVFDKMNWNEWKPSIELDSRCAYEISQEAAVTFRSIH